VPSEFFDLLSTSPDRWTTLRMSGRDWRDTGISHQAWDAGIARIRASGASVTTITLGRSDVPEPPEHEHTWTLWLAPPWKRAIFTVATDTVDVVFHGPTWWGNSRGASISNDSPERARSKHGLGYGEDLVRTRDYVTSLEIQEIGEGSWIDRPTLDVRARAVHHSGERRRGKGLHGLIIGDADRIDLSVDRERGVILRAASWYEGSMYRTLEALDVVFDETFPSDAFKIEPLPGQSW
jgi:hypothetical protein